MEKKHEDPTDVRVRLYRKALAQLKEVNERKEREAEQKERQAKHAKEAEADTVKEPHEPSTDRDHTIAHEHSDKA
jgi:hypothetical protein